MSSYFAHLLTWVVSEHNDQDFLPFCPDQLSKQDNGENTLSLQKEAAVRLLLYCFDDLEQSPDHDHRKYQIPVFSSSVFHRLANKDKYYSTNNIQFSCVFQKTVGTLYLELS